VHHQVTLPAPPTNPEVLSVRSDLDGGDPLKNSCPGSIDHMSGDIFLFSFCQTLKKCSILQQKNI
jgi:hypothetical protein